MTTKSENSQNFPTAFGDSSYADLLEKWTDTSLKLGMPTTSTIVQWCMECSHRDRSGGFFGVNQTSGISFETYTILKQRTTTKLDTRIALDDRLRFNAVYFYNDFKDKQESFVALDPDTRTVATVFDNAATVNW